MEEPDDTAAIGNESALCVRADVRRWSHREERLARVNEDRSILDGLTQQISKLSGRLGARDRTKLGEYFDAVRDLEQRIAKAESYNSDFSVPEQPVGVPPTFREYVELMFDLQVLAFQADITRVSSFMMARENINRSYPEIGLPEAHHSMSHHGNNPEKMKAFAKLNTYHVETMLLPEEAGIDPRRRRQPAGSHRGAVRRRHERRQHAQQLQRACGHGGWGALSLKGNRHVRFPKGTPLANLMLGVMDRFGVNVDKFGDSTAEIDLLTV